MARNRELMGSRYIELVSYKYTADWFYTLSVCKKVHLLAR